MDYDKLQHQIKGKQCFVCHESPPRIAWVNGDFALRCACFPKAPALEKLPKSELSKAIADPEYPTDAVTRMQAERIREKREST